MDRAEAEAVFDAGREACVDFLLELTSGYDAQIARLEERIRRLEEQARQDSRTSSKPPSSDPPKTRAQRRAEARAKAKELMRREGEGRKAGGQSRAICSAPRCRPAAWTRSASAPRPHWLARICSCRTGCWIRARCMSMRPA